MIHINKKIIASFCLISVVAGLVFVASTSFADNLPPASGASGLVPCGNFDPTSMTFEQYANMSASSCTFDSILQLIKNVMWYIFIISVPVSIIAFVWVGILFITAQGNSSKITRAKGIFTNVLIGFLFILGAWLIVYMITSALLNPDYNKYMQQTQNNSTS